MRLIKIEKGDDAGRKNRARGRLEGDPGAYPGMDWKVHINFKDVNRVRKLLATN